MDEIRYRTDKGSTISLFCRLESPCVQFRLLLVQRCNDTPAGLGYLEVEMYCPCISPFGQRACVRTIMLKDIDNLNNSVKVTVNLFDLFPSFAQCHPDLFQRDCYYKNIFLSLSLLSVPLLRPSYPSDLSEKV
jgi:hypothetical protein